MTRKVLCQAPLTAALIDTNKGIRPCCVYKGPYIGNLKTDSLNDVINGPEWSRLKEQMYANEWAEECLSCKQREEVTGWSVRQLFLNQDFDIEGWETEKLTYLEFNGSNICNLACLHCNAGFSSKWVIDHQKAKAIKETLDPETQKLLSRMDAVNTYDDDVSNRSSKMHLPNDVLVIERLKNTDLSMIRTINFKGGEPMLNSETEAILEYLDKQSLLNQVTIVMSTNGTYVNDNVIELLKKCKSVKLYISVDGIGELFNYIRYGDAKFDDVEPTIAKLNTIDCVEINVSTSVMNYNIFNLVDIRDWCKKISEKYNKVNPLAGFANCVQEPSYLSVNTLSSSTQYELRNYYKDTQSNRNEFAQVINALNGNYLGDETRKKWIAFTRLMQEVRKNNILKSVPQLVKELR